MGRSHSQQSQALNDVHSLNLDVPNREIYLSSLNNDNPDENGCDDEVGQKLANMFLKNVRFLDLLNNNAIIIHLQTPGGSVAAGLAMYDAIKSSKSHITVIGHGLVDSMGTVIIQAADTRILMPHCEFMVHYGHNYMDGTHIETKHQMEWLERQNDVIMDIYVERCVHGVKFKEHNRSPRQTKRTLESILKQKSDWFMTAKEAVEYGFADGILGEAPYETIAAIKGV